MRQDGVGCGLARPAQEQRQRHDGGELGNVLGHPGSLDDRREEAVDEALLGRESDDDPEDGNGS